MMLEILAAMHLQKLRHPERLLALEDLEVGANNGTHRDSGS